jgi:hypothetical protein
VLESHAGSLLRSAHVLAQKLVELDARRKMAAEVKCGTYP